MVGFSRTDREDALARMLETAAGTNPALPAGEADRTSLQRELVQLYADRALSEEAARLVAGMIARDQSWSDAYENLLVERARNCDDSGAQ